MVSRFVSILSSIKVYQPANGRSTPAIPMVEKTGHMKVWMAALERGVLDPEEANKVLKGYKAGVDLPLAGW